jgi:Arc/MetJ-type ribon-helix-helix transcriptional regulator
MVQKQKPTVIHGLRINAELRNRIAVAMQKGGFSSRSAFIRAAVERELAGRESDVDAAEQRIAASLDRMAREIRNLRLGQQALFAFVDVLVKTLLTCVPEPPRDVHDQAVARGKARYDRFLKSRRAGVRRAFRASLAVYPAPPTRTSLRTALLPPRTSGWIRPWRPRPLHRQ